MIDALMVGHWTGTMSYNIDWWFDYSIKIYRFEVYLDHHEINTIQKEEYHSQRTCFGSKRVSRSSRCSALVAFIDRLLVNILSYCVIHIIASRYDYYRT